jgi:redox-sensitive bicupin YhaK (pirin superfamily)
MRSGVKKMKVIKKISSPIRDDIADLRTVRALPTQHVQHIDPFLFLNHHGHQLYPPHNNGLPFGPHPHRGFETVTFILQGDISHRDSAGNESIIQAGGIQWMTAGKGLVHEEVSSSEFKEKGGDLEILQLWLNLPAKLKMTDPAYIGLQYDEIPHLTQEGVKLNLIAGSWNNHEGVVKPLVDITLMTIEMLTESSLKLETPEEHNIFFYLVKGEIEVNGETIASPRLVEFQNQGKEISIKSETDSYILFGHAQPFNEPIVSYGPFVMNTREEIIQAIQDYESGKIK